MRQIRLNKNKRGFTLIELLFSITFISILALTIVVITMNILADYRRGLTIKQINTTGNDLIDDFRAAIADSSAKSILDLCASVYKDQATNQSCQDDYAYSFINLVRIADVEIGDDKSENHKVVKDVPVYGAFCSGTYSYIWNSGYFFGENYSVNTSKATFKYTDVYDGTEKTATDFRILKVKDPSRTVCVSQKMAHETGAVYFKNTSLRRILKSDFVVDNNYGKIVENPVELLVGVNGKNDLALYEFNISQPAQDPTTRNTFYSGTFILATVTGGINIKASGNYCATPAEYDIENFDYCAINNFKFAIQASGE